jgi:hypothetical protein
MIARGAFTRGAAACPLAASVQQIERVRRIGVLLPTPSADVELVR